MVFFFSTTGEGEQLGTPGCLELLRLSSVQREAIFKWWTDGTRQHLTRSLTGAFDRELNYTQMTGPRIGGSNGE